MVTILIRTLLVYILLILTMRLMGKRQLSELEISELVTTLLISEIASLPIADPNIPVMHAVIPLVTILTLEIALSIILLKCPALKNIVSTRPSVLIRCGIPDQRELRRVRISIDELISEVRQSGVSTLEDVDYAILEPNGRISILPKKCASPPSAKDLNIILKESGVIHALIEDGNVNNYTLQLLGYDRPWLDAYLQKKRQRASDLFFLGVDDAGDFYTIKKEQNK